MTTVTPITDSRPDLGVRQPRLNSTGFDVILAGTRSLHGSSADAGSSEVKDAAVRFVSSALVVPVFSQLRETSVAEGPFAPGHAEKHFGPMLDMMLADRVTAGANFPLVDAIVRQFGGEP